MNGTARTWVSIGYASTVWTVADTGDFNNDNQTDILWRNYSTGQNVVWFMVGIQKISSSYMSSASTDWHIASTGDFNNDGKTDILWRNYTTGANGYWLLDGIVSKSWAPISSVATSWEIQHKD